MEKTQIKDYAGDVIIETEQRILDSQKSDKKEVEADAGDSGEETIGADKGSP